VKSEPEPRSPTATSSLGALACVDMPGVRVARLADLQLPLVVDRAALGAGTSLVTSRMNCLSEGTASAEIASGHGHIDVEVGDGVLQHFGVLLHPFG
jgi:hypothetical protein